MFSINWISLEKRAIRDECVRIERRGIKFTMVERIVHFVGCSINVSVSFLVYCMHPLTPIHEFSAITFLGTAWVRLNQEKWRFEYEEPTFSGHTFNADGALPDPEETYAVANFARPNDKACVRKFPNYARSTIPSSILRTHIRAIHALEETAALSGGR